MVSSYNNKRKGSLNHGFSKSNKNFGQKLDNYIIIFWEYNQYSSSHIIVGLTIKFKLNDI